MTAASQLRRRSDPASSAESARSLVASGAHGSQVERIYELLDAAERRQGRPATASEVEQEANRRANLDGWPRYQTYVILKRLSDLRDGGRVENGPTIVCPVTRRTKTTWRILRQTKLSLITSVSGDKGRPSRGEILDALQTLLEQVQRSTCEGSGPAQDEARAVLRRAGR